MWGPSLQGLRETEFPSVKTAREVHCYSGGLTTASSELMWKLFLHPILEGIQTRRGKDTQVQEGAEASRHQWLWSYRLFHTGHYCKQFQWKFYLAVRIPFTSFLLSSIQPTCSSLFSSPVVFRHKGFSFVAIPSFVREVTATARSCWEMCWAVFIFVCQYKLMSFPEIELGIFGFRIGSHRKTTVRRPTFRVRTRTSSVNGLCVDATSTGSAHRALETVA